MTKSKVGTPLYQAPEILLDRGDYDSSVDVWSVGVIFFKMLSGEVPFPGETIEEVVAKIMERKYLLPNYLKKTPFAENFFKGCLQYEPKERLKLKDICEQRYIMLHDPYSEFSHKDQTVTNNLNGDGPNF